MRIAYILQNGRLCTTSYCNTHLRNVHESIKAKRSGMAFRFIAILWYSVLLFGFIGNGEWGNGEEQGRERERRRNWGVMRKQGGGEGRKWRVNGVPPPHLMHFNCCLKACYMSIFNACVVCWSNLRCSQPESDFPAELWFRAVIPAHCVTAQCQKGCIEK